MVGTTKERTIEREELLYSEPILAAVADEYGHETDIKRHVKTTAKTYEIRTALEYWFGSYDPRCSKAVWRRIKLHHEDGVPPEECERL